MSGMTGTLRLVLGLDGSGRCSLRENYSTELHRVLHLVPGETPEEGVVYVVNPTGGILQGDTLDAEIRVEAGAHAIVTTPSATKIHRMDGQGAISTTRLRVERGAMLEFVPEPVIPFGGSSFVEDLAIDVEAGGRLLAWEILAPGRRARGEVFEYDLLGLRLRLSEGGAVTLRERSDLRPREGGLGSLSLGDGSYYGVLLVVGGDADRLVDSLRPLLAQERAGVSRLPGTGVIVKMIASEGRRIEGAFRRLRERILTELAGRPATALRTV